MRKSGWIAFAAMLLACAGAPERTEAPPPASVHVAPTAPESISLPPEPGRLPSGGAAVVGIDPARLDRWLQQYTGKLKAPALDELAQELGVTRDALLSGSALQGSGVDPKRPIEVSVSKLEPGAATVLDTGLECLGDLAAKGFVPNGLAKHIRRAVRAQEHPPVNVRIIVPASDVEKLLGSMRNLLAARGYPKDEVVEGLDDIYILRERVVTMTATADRVVVDIQVFVSKDPPRLRVLDALRAARTKAATAPEAVPELESDAIRARYRPADVAALGFVETLARTHEAVQNQKGPEADWGMLDGLRNAGHVVSLAKGERGAFFESVDVRVRFHDALPELRLEGKLGPGFRGASGCVPSPSVDFPGALSRFDLTTSCLRSIPVPGDAEGGPLTQSAFRRNAEALRLFAQPVALPWYPLGIARTPLNWYAGIGSQAMLRFERFGWSNPAFGAPDVFWGLMARGASPDDVRCAAAESEALCRGNRAIQPTRVNDVGGAFVRTVTVGDRVVVLASRSREAVQAMSPVLTAEPVPPLRAAVSAGSMVKVLEDLDLTGLQTRYVGHLELGSERMTWVAQPM